MRLKKLVATLGLTGALLVPSTTAAAVTPWCNVWTTISTTPKSYSPCNYTTIGPWTSPFGGCLRWVSWRVTQVLVRYNGVEYRDRKTYLHNEVQSQWTVTVGPVLATKTQTIPGSHTSSLQTSTRDWGGWYTCSKFTW